jgi:methylthioribose-1-phosphate isomerase
MLVNGKQYRTIWLDEGDEKIRIIDQRYLPHQFIIEDLLNVEDVINAITDMHVRGAGLIGAAAGYGMYLAVLEGMDHKSFKKFLFQKADMLKASRPTAVNLEWAVNRQLEAISRGKNSEEFILLSKETARSIADEDSDFCQSIGNHGVKLIEDISERKNGQQVNILTHCNAGWLAFTDFGTATSPIYLAHDRGYKVHVWVDETRPRNQGANLTAWELLNHGVPHTLIADNTGGYLMQTGKVDLVITGADRVTRTGDAANKIGTYLKALAAKDNGIPFYIAIPSSTIDWEIESGLDEIPIEERGEQEIKYVIGWLDDHWHKVLIGPEKSPALNVGFDITPSELITGFITERGICKASEKGLLSLFPEYVSVP